MLSHWYVTTKVLIRASNWYSLLFLFIGSFIIYLITLNLIIPLVHYLIVRSPTKLDNALMDRKVFKRLVLVPSLIFINYYSHLIGEYETIINRLVTAAFIWVFILAFDKFLLAVNDIYERLSIAKGKPIKGFIQIFEIIIYLFGGIITIAIIVGRSPWMLISSLGAMTALLILVFKDTILSLVASIRITANNLIEVGDWIEMPQYGADGDVIDIALHSIQVQNWDKTITCIPTHKLIEDSFKNWKGIQIAGGRRIMRNILIDVSSINFCDEEMLAKYEKIAYLQDYLQQKKEEIAQHNRSIGIAEDDYTNGRHLTNIGTFRAYIVEYIKRHPHINHNLTTLIRQMQPDTTGLPLQIWAFTKTTAWGEYENIQADIFDHLLAVVPFFDLRVFQNPSGRDIQNIKSLSQ